MSKCGLQNAAHCARKSLLNATTQSSQAPPVPAIPPIQPVTLPPPTPKHFVQTTFLIGGTNEKNLVCYSRETHALRFQVRKRLNLAKSTYHQANALADEVVGYLRAAGKLGANVYRQAAA